MTTLTCNACEDTMVDARLCSRCTKERRRPIMDPVLLRLTASFRDDMTQLIDRHCPLRGHAHATSETPRTNT